MSLKTLLFGQNTLISKMLHQINPNISEESQQAVRVQNTLINQKNFMLFAIQDRSLIAQQSVGSNALIFFIDHEKPLYEEKQFLIDILNSKRQFQNVPLVVLFQKQQGLNIKDVINYLELFKMKQRTSMIKQINFNQKESVIDAFQWIQNQSQFRKSRTTFDAMPKVVKMKPKYRQSQQDESVKKYETLLKEKQFRSRDIKDQEQTYITQQKERIKNENMQKQLANFNKNKKKMTPYDIKATPNPKIDANLHFFLKDPKSQKEQQVNIKIQTDQFKPRPPQKAYVPKKTGINISTQIEQNQLFNFDKEVRPILNILTIKALQTAALEIQEQQQFARIQKYKSAYNDRVKKQKQHEEKMIQDEMALIKKKEKLLEEARKKHQIKKNIKKRLICYDISSRFLQNIYKRSNLNLYNKNQYFDPYENEIKTSFLDQLISKTSGQLQKLAGNAPFILEKQSSIMGVFQKDVIQPILQKSEKPKKQRQILRNAAAKRRINESQNQRIVRALYKHQSQTFSSFSKYIDKNFEGRLEQFVRIKEEEYQDISDKISTGDLPEDELTKKKSLQNQQFGKSHQAYIIDSDKQICFTITPNQYQKVSQNLFSLGFLIVDRQGQIIQSDFVKKSLTKNHSFAKHIKDLRSIKKVVNMDQGILLNLKNIPENAKSIILLSQFNNVEKYNQEQQNKKVRHASYGIEFYEKNVPIHKYNLSQKINWAQLIKPQEGGSQNQQNQDLNLFSVSYILHRKGDDYWNIQHTRYIPKPTLQQSKFIQQLARYYAKSLQIFKEQDEEDNNVGKRSASKKERRGKSKKSIEEPVKPKVAIKVSSRILSEVKVDLRGDFQQIKSKLQDSVKQWKEFVQSCQAGYEIVVKGQKLQSIEQLRKFKKIGDIEIIKLKPVVEIEEEKKEGEEIEAYKNQED